MIGMGWSLLRRGECLSCLDGCRVMSWNIVAWVHWTVSWPEVPGVWITLQYRF